MSDFSYIRLSKLFSENKVCSRRTAEKWIENRWVQVNGKAHTEPGQTIHPHSLILITPEAIEETNKQISIILNKPPGYVCTFKDPKHKHALSLIQTENFFIKNKLKPDPTWDLRNLAPTGRLDALSRGLVIFTQDGRLAKKIIGPESNIDKEYLVQVKGQIESKKISLLRHGLSLDGRKLKPAQVNLIDKKKQILKFILKEGRNRQIRRMCHLVNLEVLDLQRLRIGPIKLKDLPEGQWQLLDSNLF